MSAGHRIARVVHQGRASCAGLEDDGLNCLRLAERRGVDNASARGAHAKTE